MSEITVQIKTPSRSENFNVTLKSDHTVAQAKDVISMSCDTPASRQRLIFAGRVLKDTQILSDCSMYFCILMFKDSFIDFLFFFF